MSGPVWAATADFEKTALLVFLPPLPNLTFSLGYNTFPRLRCRDFFGDKADHPSKHGNPYLVEEEAAKRKAEEIEQATLSNKV